MKPPEIEMQIAIIRFLAHSTEPKAGAEIHQHLQKHFRYDFNSGPTFTALRRLRYQDWVVLKGRNEKGDRLFALNKDKGRWQEKVDELERAKERLGPETEGLGGLSPA